MGRFSLVEQDLEIAGGKGIQRNAGNTAFEAVYTNPDYFKYQIVTSVASGNLTVALKNYLGTNPSATTPVKIQIGDTIRTITSALSKTSNAGQNYFNSGSSELATKEIDYFFYLLWDTSNSSVGMAFSRFPSANILGDLNLNGGSPQLAEKGFEAIYNSYGASYAMVNIGRFNAILSAGAGYTWSIPATSVIENRPIYETRWLDYTPTVSASGSMTVTGTLIEVAKYRITSGKLEYQFRINSMTLGGTASSQITLTNAFTPNDYAGNVSTFYPIIVTDPGSVRKIGFGYYSGNLLFQKGDNSNFTLGATAQIFGGISLPL